MAMSAERILFTCHINKIKHLHCTCQMQLHYNPALWYSKPVNVKRKPAHTLLKGREKRYHKL